jgi:biotin synthase
MVQSDVDTFRDIATNGQQWERDHLLSILSWPDGDLETLIEGAFELRRKYFDKDIRLKFLMNAKSGLCPEDCNYCSQSQDADSEIEKYSWRSKEELLEGAEEAASMDSSRYCIVASGRGPSDQEIEFLEEAIPEIKEQYDLKLCLSLGLLTEDHAYRLADAGVDIINHNLNTSPDYYEEICSTHTFEDRVNTLENVEKAGMTTCSGGIVGMGEEPEDLVELALELRAQDPEIVPVNFLVPVPGTPLENEGDITTEESLKALCMFRYVLPESDLTISAGREWHLGPAQKKALKVGTSLFIGDYLTTKGEEAKEDYQMLEEEGYNIVGNPEPDMTAVEPEPV